MTSSDTINLTKENAHCFLMWLFGELHGGNQFSKDDYWKWGQQARVLRIELARDPLFARSVHALDALANAPAFTKATAPLDSETEGALSEAFVVLDAVKKERNLEARPTPPPSNGMKL